MARVLIVYPNMYDPCMPMGITSLSSYLKDAGHEVKLFDTTLYKLDDVLTKPQVYIRDKVFKPHKLWYEKMRISREELYTIYKKCIDDYDPDVIAISIGAQDMLVMGDDLINWAADIKRPDTILAIGGVIPSVLPDRFIDRADAVCVGEGESSLLDIVSGCRGIIHGKVVDVDELLYPDWDLMSGIYMRWPFGTTVYRFGRFMRTRGCSPGTCKYCIYSNPDFPRDMARVRRKSNGVMIDEIIDRVGKYNLQFITFVDDNFLVGSRDINLEFLDMYRDKIHLPFLTTTHPFTMTPELAKAMKDAGSIHISMAIESGNEYIRREVLGRKVKDEVMINAFRLVKDQGIHCASLNMIGLPHETPENFRDTIDLNRKCMPDKSMCYYFQPYIGLPLREEAIRYGYITGKEQAVNMCDESIMKLPGFPMRTIRNYKETFNIRIRFPKYISRFMGWLAGRSQFIFNILSKYRADKI